MVNSDTLFKKQEKRPLRSLRCPTQAALHRAAAPCTTPQRGGEAGWEGRGVVAAIGERRGARGGKRERTGEREGK